MKQDIASLLLLTSSIQKSDHHMLHQVCDNYSILIITNEQSIRLLLKEALQEWFNDIHEAETGAQALNMMRTAPSQIVLLDINLPDIKGLDVLYAIRTMRSDTKVIMMSSFYDENKAKEAKEAGADGFFTKPFDLEELQIYLCSERIHKDKICDML